MKPTRNFLSPIRAWLDRGAGPAGSTAVPGLVERPEFPTFDWLRLAAAMLVLFGHSIVVADGDDRRDPLVLMFGEGSPTGTYAVCVFFVISGFLVTMSATQGRRLLPFLASRVLRIYPGLFVCQLVTALVIGTAFSTLGPAAYLESGVAWEYALHYTLDPGMTWEVPSVRFYVDDELLGRSFNASLWSLQQELVCYVIVALLMVLRLLRPAVLLVLLGISLPFFVPWSRDDVDPLLAITGPVIEAQRVQEFFWVGSCFFAGALIWFIWLKRRRLPAWPMAIAAFLFSLGLWSDRLYDLFPFWGAYPLLWAATSPRIRLPSLTRIGDLSYGIFLYGWPIQQSIRAIVGEGVSWWQIFLVATPLAAGCAYASWHLVERPALRLKRRLRRSGGSISDRRTPPGHVAPQAP